MVMEHLLCEPTIGGECNVCGVEMLISNFNEKNRDMIYIQILTI
jgi:ssDNA-binding Zn-finger/Zn-ribbon topoisomerase 1